MSRIGRRKVLGWIKEDFYLNPLRFTCEVVGMISNLIASIILMIYSPTPPMFWAYIFFIMASVLLLGAAYSRRSFGFTVMYLIYIGIDGVGFLKTLI